MKKVIIILGIAALIAGSCGGNRKNQNDSTSAGMEIDTCTEADKYVEISKFLENDIFLETIQDATFDEDFEFDESFCLRTVLKEITKQEYNQKKIKEKKILSSDTLHLDSMCLILGNYDDEDYRIKRFENQINSYLVLYEYMMDGYMPVYNYLLINKKTGKVMKIGEEPAISPNGKMLVTSNNYGDPEIYTTLLFYKINDKGLTMKKGFWERDLQIEEIYWISDKKIMIKAVTIDNEERYFSMTLD